ncbi:MAG: hypothetical protein AAF085_11540 [Planctomycetota bacterium]
MEYQLVLLAESGVENTGTLMKLAKVGVGVAIFVLVFIISMAKQPNDEGALEIYKQMPKEKLDDMRASAPKNVRHWLIAVGLLSLYLIGRQVYQIINTDAYLPDRLINIGMYALFMLVPAVLCFVLIPRPAAATDQRLTLCSKLMITSAFLTVTWGLLMPITGSGPWFSALWFLFMAVPFFLCSSVISQVRVFRRYDEDQQREA